MMQIEKDLSKMDLTQFKKSNYEHFLTQLYKHQNFKLSAVLKRVNRTSYSTHTLRAYLSAIKVYVNTGRKTRNLSGGGYKIIDKLIANHVQILTPSNEDKANEFYTKKPSPPTPPKEPPKYTEIIPNQYGVKCDNMIKLFDSKEYCLGFIECWKQLNNKEATLVKVEFEEILE